MRHAIRIMLIFVILFGAGVVPSSGGAVAQPAAPDDTPVPLVPSGVTKYTLAAPKVFWYTGVPPCPPAGPQPGDSPSADFTELIRRVATYGSPVRTLYSEGKNCDQGVVISNIVADDSYIYWLGYTGLMRLSVDANPGDAPELVNALLKAPGELAITSDRVYAIHDRTPTHSEIGYVLKSNKQLVPLVTLNVQVYNLHADGQYVYYINAGVLVRINPGVDNGVDLASGVTGYYPEGRRLLFCTINPFKCFYSDTVFIGRGYRIYTYDNQTNTLNASPIYTSADTTASVYELASVTGLLGIGGRLLFLERRTIPCTPEPCLVSYTYLVNRAGRDGSNPATLYTYSPSLLGPGLQNLTTDGTYMYFQESDKVQRLANDAAALPSVNLTVTGMEVTQGIQDTSNSVMLVKGRRTFVRLYVKSAGPSVSGVTARLSSPSAGGGSLVPVNPVGTQITVRTNPDRTDLNQSFLFELPWSWTQGSSLSLRAEVNPYKVPLEPNYADNTASASLTFSNSPSLSVEFFRLNYTIGGTTYRPRISQDVLRTYSWIMRVYPLGGAIGDKFKPRLWDVEGGTELGSWVNRTNPLCYFVYSHPGDDVSLCASYFTNGWLWYYRVASMFGFLNVGLKTNAFYYGMISDASGNFPRGQAMYSLTSVGPAGTPGQFFGLGSGWDTDGTYADWYAGHEIGHSLGRAHPNAGSDNPATPNVSENCGHSRSDPSYPYGNLTTAAAPIGPASGAMEGFDVGDAGYGIPIRVLPSGTWNDVMSYCNSQWISDYTYKGMYNYMIAHPSQPQSPQNVVVAGDFLAVNGIINPETNSAGFAFLRRLTSVVNVPDLVPGDYSLRLLDASNQVLHDYAFTPALQEDTGVLSFAQVIDFVAGARKIQVIKNAGEQVLASQEISANPPVVSDVALQDAPNPVSGVVTLNWTASDPDGDPLSFDVAYSTDNGVNFQPVAINLSGTSTQIDTASLGGSDTAILRVTASDGVNSASADSASFSMAPKPPTPYITDPADNTHIHYGQLVNFSGMALDVQDGLVADTGLVWKNAQGDVLATGPLYSSQDLPVGTNVITLEATNSISQTASADVTVIVDDDLSHPGPNLSVSPAVVSWQVNPGVTAPQTAEVSINNAGSGSLNWTASEDAGWLSTDVLSGTVSADGDASILTLSADPSGLTSGTTLTATLTISSSVAEQQVKIPVSIGIGDIHQVQVVTPPRLLYLPLVR